MRFVLINTSAMILVLLAVQGCSRQSRSGVAEFGVVLPNETISHRWYVENPSAEPMVLGGFNDACGCEAWVRGNPIIPPRGRAELNLKAVAAGSPGPHGVYFNLTTQVGTKPKQIKRYLMNWTVARLPSFEPETIKFKQGTPNTSQIRIVAGKDFDLKLHQAPTGISVERKTDVLEVHYDGRSKPGGRVEFQVGKSQFVSFACENEVSFKVGLQPWRLAIRRNTSDLLRTFGRFSATKCPQGIFVKRDGDSLQVRVASSCPIGLAEITLVDQGQSVAVIPIEVLP